MKTSEVITGAIDLIREYGLNKGDYGDTTRGFCTVGAMDIAAGWRDPAGYHAGAFSQAKEYVAEAAGTVSWGIVAWSDAPETTKELVLTTLATAREHALRVEGE